MKVPKGQLKKIVKEEIEKLLQERLGKAKLWNLVSKAKSGTIIDFNKIGGLRLGNAKILTITKQGANFRVSGKKRLCLYTACRWVGPITVTYPSQKVSAALNKLPSSEINKINDNAANVMVKIGTKSMTLIQYAAAPQVVTTPPRGTTPPPTPQQPVDLLGKLGGRGGIKTLQEWLKTYSKKITGAGKRVMARTEVNGEWDATSRSSLIAFQIQVGMNPSNHGTFNKATVLEIFKASGVVPGQTSGTRSTQPPQPAAYRRTY